MWLKILKSPPAVQERPKHLQLVRAMLVMFREVNNLGLISTLNILQHNLYGQSENQSWLTFIVALGQSATMSGGERVTPQLNISD